MTILTDKIATIDASFPLQGRENSSQGFRDNFANIKDSLTEVATELESLQTSNLDITSPETSLGFNTLSDATLKNSFGRINIENITQTNDIEIDILLGGAEYYKYIIGAGVSIVSFTNWPQVGLVAKIRLELVSDGTARTIGIGTAGSTVTTLPSAGSSTVIEVWSYDQGNSIYITTLGNFEVVV